MSNLPEVQMEVLQPGHVLLDSNGILNVFGWKIKDEGNFKQEDMMLAIMNHTAQQILNVINEIKAKKAEAVAIEEPKPLVITATN
jgi:hypothetical protein